MSHNKQKIFFDAMVLAPQHMSGVGHNALEIIRAVDHLSESHPELEVHLVVTLGKSDALRKYKFRDKIIINTLPLPAKVIELLLRLHILPPIDIFLGKGLYIFPNYRKWPVVRSKSYLYVHDLTFVRYPEYVQPKNLQYLQKYLIRWARTATRIITISEFSKQEIEDYFKIPEEQITVVPCGVDTSVFYQRSKLEIDNIKKRYGITTQKYIFYIGNLEPRKNLVNLVKAFSGLPQKIKNEYALVIVGGGGWLNEGIYKAIETAKSNGTTIIQPTVYVADADVPALFSGATALVHPAYYEGFGLSILQAMACKTPVLVAKNSSIPELVGNAGLYLNPNSEEDIAKKIMTIISNKDLSDRLVVSGLQRAKIFDWDTSARKLLNLS